MFKYEGRRNSYVAKGEIYFWTATIHEWKPLLAADEYKDVIINSLNWLVQNKFAEVYAFVIMPNHIHLLWQVIGTNGKESPHGSFLKYTAHLFRRMLYHTDKALLQQYAIKITNKAHEFWQRDPLAVPIYGREVANQKIDYIHHNPLAPHWQLCSSPEEYVYSSRHIIIRASIVSEY